MRPRMSTALSLVSITLGNLVTAQDSTPSADLDEVLYGARVARAAYDLAKERKLLERAVGLEGDAADLARAHLRLARVDWMYSQRDEAARERLRDATTGAEPGEAWRELVRLEMARQRFEAAGAAASKIAAVGDTVELRQWGRVAVARSIIESTAAARRHGGVVSTNLSKAVSSLREIVEEQPGQLVPSRALVRGAVLARDIAALHIGWASYYRIDAVGNGPNAIDIRGMRAALERWPSTAEEFVALAVALSDSRMFAAAQLVSLDPDASDAVRAHPRVVEISAYAVTVRRLLREITEYYRSLSLGRRDPGRLDKIVTQTLQDLTPQLVGVGPDETPSKTELHGILRERFGTKLTIGTTSGFYCAHIGHIVTDETREFEQYSQKGTLRFVALDNNCVQWVPRLDCERYGPLGRMGRARRDVASATGLCRDCHQGLAGIQRRGERTQVRGADRQSVRARRRAGTGQPTRISARPGPARPVPGRDAAARPAGAARTRGRAAACSFHPRV